AQIASEVATERWRARERQEALEAAANVLEAARVCSWDELTPSWAGGQALPAPLAARLQDGRLEVRVAPEPSRPHRRRVTVRTGGSHGSGRPAPPVGLVALRSARSAIAAGGEP